MLLERISDSIRLTITRGEQYLVEWTLKDSLDSLLTEVELREENVTAQRGGSNDRRKRPLTRSAIFTNKGGEEMCILPWRPPPEHCKKVQDINERKKL